MRIGIDARELCGNATGVGRYLGGLIREWSTCEKARRHEFVLYAHEPLGTLLDARRFATRVVEGNGGSVWEQKHLPAAIARDHLDVFFAPGYTAPLLVRVPLVVAIHDVSFAAHPEWFTAREGFRRRFLSRRAAAAARAVVTISQFTRDELIELLGVPRDRIHVIPPGVDAVSAPSHTPRVPLSPVQPRILYVGSIFNRRHVPDLIRAFGQLARAHPDLRMDLVGDNRSHPREDIAASIKRHDLSHQVHWHRYVSEDQLADLYRSSGAFAFLSEYEGLGLTPLEALASGVPSVLLDTPVARESCGDAALYVAKGDIPATTAALSRLLFDQPTRESLLQARPAVLARYDWPRSAAATLDLLEKSQ